MSEIFGMSSITTIIILIVFLLIVIQGIIAFDAFGYYKVITRGLDHFILQYKFLAELLYQGGSILQLFTDSNQKFGKWTFKEFYQININNLNEIQFHNKVILKAFKRLHLLRSRYLLCYARSELQKLVQRNSRSSK